MQAPNKNLWRFLIRSKDRISGTPNNFRVQLPSQITEDCSEVYVRLSSICCGAFPLESDTVTTTYSNGGFSNQFDLLTNSNPYGFATNGAVDLCLNLLPINTLDSETALAPHIFIASAVINAGTGVTLMTIPCINRMGVFASGVTPSAVGDSLRIGTVSGTVISFGIDTIVIQFASQNTPSIPTGTLFQVTSANPVKLLSDRTLSLIPYSRGSGERSLRLYNESPWVRVGSTQFGVLTVKPFDDHGFALKIRKIYASTNAVDMLDCNICDWTMQLDVALAPQKVIGLI